MLIKVNVFGRQRAFCIFLKTDEEKEIICPVDGGNDSGHRPFPGILDEEELFGREQAAQPAYASALPGDLVQAAGVQTTFGFVGGQAPHHAGPYGYGERGKYHTGEGT
jgi:hypothetical protein